MEYLLVLPFVLAYFLKGISRVHPNEVGLVESKGVYSKFLTPGTYFIPQFFKRLVTVTTQDRKFEVKTSITTNDGIICKTVIKIIFYVEPTEKNVRNYFMIGGGFTNDIVISIANSIFGEIPYKEIAEKRDIICEFITKNLKKQIIDYGIKIRSLELDAIYPPEEIQKADLNIISKRKKREASKLESEAIRTKAEAIKQHDQEVSNNKRKLIEEEAQIKIMAKEKIKQKELEIAQLIKEDLEKDLKKKKREVEKIYDNLEKESLAKVLQNE